MKAVRWWTALSPVVRAALLMLLGGSAVAVQLSALRIASASVHPFEIALFRNLIGVLVILPFLGRLGPQVLRLHQPGLVALSGCGLLVGMILFLLAVTHIPLAEITVLTFTKPLFATLGAAVLLGEVVRGRRWSAVLIGFLGVLIVLRPGAQAVSPYALLILASALLLAGVSLLVKRLTATESATTIVLYQAVFMTLFAVPLAIPYWQTPTLFELFLLLLFGGLGTIKELCATRAFALVDASVVVPFEFARLPLTALAAYLLFAEVPTVWIWLGGAVIFASTAYITHRELRAIRTRRAAAVAP